MPSDISRLLYQIQQSGKGTAGGISVFSELLDFYFLFFFQTQPSAPSRKMVEHFWGFGQVRLRQGRQALGWDWGDGSAIPALRDSEDPTLISVP